VVINVLANGRDNVAEDPRPARDRAVAKGMAVNGLVIGAGRTLADYFRTHVRGGAGSFVLEVTAAPALLDAMIEKLLRDLVAVRAPPSDGGQRCEGVAAAAPPGS
jgi:Ca-activated chloride channel homolog